jgi:undecaprenyl-diphosphatase
MDVVPQLFGMKDPGAAFSAVVQLGPIFAIIAYFRTELAAYARGVWRSKSPKAIKSDDLDARLGWFTILGTIPLCIFGFLLEKKIDHEFRSLYVVAFSLIALAFVLMWAEKVGKKNRDLANLTLPQSQVIGWAQVLALVPGASRSGVTITAGLFQGLDRESAAKFSFLLSIPAITLAGLYKLFKIVKENHGLGGPAGEYIAAAVIAGIVAYAVIYWFLGYMKEHSTGGFIIYRIALGVLILVLLQTHYLVQPAAPGAQTALRSGPAPRLVLSFNERRPNP